jgi:hypothetical protein
MRSSSLPVILFVIASSSTCHAFSPSRPGETASKTISRKSFVQQVSLAIVGVAGTTFAPMPVHADIKSQLATPTAVRTIKRARRGLSSFELYIANDDYESLKQALRNEPFSDLRKACSTIVRGAEETPGADVLLKDYQDMIFNLEKLDSLNNVAMRGRKLGENEFQQSYNGLVKSLDAFITVADASAILE